MFHIKANLHHGDAVLIQAGCSPVGLAALSVAFSYNCQIFTTVFNMQQKAYLMKKFAYVSMLVEHYHYLDIYLRTSGVIPNPIDLFETTHSEFQLVTQIRQTHRKMPLYHGVSSFFPKNCLNKISLQQVEALGLHL